MVIDIILIFMSPASKSFIRLSLSDRNWGLPIILLLLTLPINLGRIIRHSFKNADEIKWTLHIKTESHLTCDSNSQPFTHLLLAWKTSFYHLHFQILYTENEDEHVYSCDKWQWWLSWKAEETAQWEKAIAPQVQRLEFRALELTSIPIGRGETEIG